MFNVLSPLIQSLLYDDDLYKVAIVMIIQYEYIVYLRFFFQIADQVDHFKNRATITLPQHAILKVTSNLGYGNTFSEVKTIIFASKMEWNGRIK